MGYTHYWQVPGKEYDQKTWDTFIKDCKTLYKRMPAVDLSNYGVGDVQPLLLNGCYAHKNAVFSKSKICFNGTYTTKRRQITENKNKYWEDILGKDDPALGHETFIVLRKVGSVDQVIEDGDPRHFSFCKTARKPYDLMVTACLILYKHYFPEVRISSDGDIDEWKESFKFIAEVLPHGKEAGFELLMNESLFEEVTHVIG